MLMKKFSEEIAVALLTTSGSPEIDISHYSTGEVHIVTGATYVTLTYYTVSPAGTFYAAQDAAGSPVTQTVAADKSYPIPAVVMGAAKIQIRSNAAGNIRITLKS